MAAKTAERTTTQAPPRQAPTDNLPAMQEKKQTPPIVQFREYVDARMQTLMNNLPPTISPKRFVGVVMTALQNKPNLLNCTFQSLWNACVRAAQDGLLPDGREGAIAPYGENKDGNRVAEIATWMPMVEGYRKKIFEAGKVKSWEVNVVYEKDDFDWELGDNAFIRHKPYMGAGPSGGVVGAYSIAKLASGETVREVMTAFQIKQVQDKSKAKNGPWKDAAFFPEMCKKVVARRHYKQLPHSESMDKMISHDDRNHGLIDPADTPPIAPPPRTRRLSSHEAFDAYAGETIDHETGEVTDFSDDDFQEQPTAAASSRGGGKGADASPSGSNASASEGTASTGTEASKEAGAVANSAPASNSGEKTDTAETSQEREEQLDDGADRPWPPGTEPTDVKEYERYLMTELEKITDASKVAPWFNSKEQVELREKCKAAAEFKRFMQIAIDYRKSVASKPVR